MNCDHYCVFTHDLYRLLQPNGGIELALVGWNGGVIGNHAQILASLNDDQILCDPTIGLVAKGVTLNSLCRGIKPTQGQMKSFYDLPRDRLEMTKFNQTVIDALANGKYMAQDILYCFPTTSHYLKAGDIKKWATPQSWNL